MFSPKILENFKRGDESAFRYYYEMYYPALCLFGIRMVKEEDDVLDIVQDVFVNLWKARETNRIVGSHENVFVPIHADIVV